MPTITRLFGVELEFFLIDENGDISNKGDRVLSNLKNQLKETEVKKECGHSMLELVSFPHRSSKVIFGKFFEDFERLLYELEVNDLGLYNLGTYPGVNTSMMRTEKRYSGKKHILGEQNWEVANKCIGFHFHYSLPRKAFNSNINFFYPDIRPQKKYKVKNLYNLYVALDPAVGTLMQSSPYYEGRRLGKDARTIMYRGNLGRQGLYSSQPEFGSLNSYADSFESIKDRVFGLSSRWKELLKENNLTFRDFAKESSILDSSWNPVKMSPHGTIESRGADMNSLSNVVAMSSLMKIISKFTQDYKIQVTPGEIGNKEPFKLEGDQLYVPDYETLKDLEGYGAWEGLENPGVFKYAASLLNLLKKITPVEYRAPMRVFSKMVSEKETVSDKIIKYAGDMDGDKARDIALKTSKDIFKDLVITKKMAENNLIFY